MFNKIKKVFGLGKRDDKSDKATLIKTDVPIVTPNTNTSNVMFEGIDGTFAVIDYDARECTLVKSGTKDFYKVFHDDYYLRLSSFGYDDDFRSEYIYENHIDLTDDLITLFDAYKVKQGFGLANVLVEGLDTFNMKYKYDKVSDILIHLSETLINLANWEDTDFNLKLVPWNTSKLEIELLFSDGLYRLSIRDIDDPNDVFRFKEEDLNAKTVQDIIDYSLVRFYKLTEDVT